MSFPSYPEYKDSSVEWLGEVPAHWEQKPFFSLISERSESNSGMKQDNLLSLSYGRIVNKDINTLDGLLPASFETYQVVYPGDIVFRLTDLQNDKRSLRSAIVREVGIITSAYLAGTCKKILPEFASHLFRAYDTLKVFYSMGGGLRQSMKYSDMKWLPILLPNEQEQTQIARFLDHETARIDALIEEQQRLIELLKEKRQAVISHAVTKGLDPTAPMKDSGVEWLGEVPAHWVVLAIKWRARIKSGDGISPDLIESQAQEDKPHPVIGGNGVMGFTSQANVSPPLIVIGRVGALCGNVHKILDPAWVSDNALILDFDRRSFDINYLVHVLDARNLNEISDKSAQPLITGSKVTSQYIPCPSRHEQLAIAKFLEGALSEFDQLVLEGIKGIELLKERRSALISAAVTGKIDVRGWQPPTSVPSPELAQEAM